MTDEDHKRIVSDLMRVQALALDGANAEIARLWRENEKLKKQIAQLVAMDTPEQNDR